MPATVTLGLSYAINYPVSSLVAESATSTPLVSTPWQAPVLAPNPAVRPNERCLLQAWAHARRWQTKVHLLFIATSSLAACFSGRLIVVRSWGGLSSGASLQRLEAGLLSHRRFHVMVPELQRLQLGAIFRYLNKQGKLGRVRLRPSTFKLSVFGSRLRSVRYGLLRPLKFRSTRAINFRKNFLRLRRLYFKRLRTSFFFGRIRPQTARRVLARFTNKRNLALNLMFSLNPHKLACRVFPFMDRFLLRRLVQRGEVYVNGRQLGPSFDSLKVGDLVRLAGSKAFFRIYARWVNKHQAYIAIMNKNLHRHYKSQRQRTHTRRKQYLTQFTWYTGFYRAVPTWLEVSFVSMSFFLVKSPTKLGFASSTFNPYLNKLLAFK